MNGLKISLALLNSDPISLLFFTTSRYSAYLGPSSGIPLRKSEYLQPGDILIESSVRPILRSAWGFSLAPRSIRHNSRIGRAGRRLRHRLASAASPPVKPLRASQHLLERFQRPLFPPSTHSSERLSSLPDPSLRLSDLTPAPANQPHSQFGCTSALSPGGTAWNLV